METEEEPQPINHFTSEKHSIPVRRSPRLLGSSPSSTPTKPIWKEKKSKSPLESKKSMALSMHVVDLDIEEAVPLKIYDPTDIQSTKKCLRRSPRYTTNKYRSAFRQGCSEKSLAALPSEEDSRTPEIPLRRSPRFSSAGKSVDSREMGVVFSVKSKKRPVSEENPIALHGSESGSRLKKLKVCSKSLRKSPRLNKSLDEVVKRGNSKNGLLALSKPCSSESLRKSPRLNPNLKTVLLALPEPGKGASVRNDSGKCVASGKRLRNRTIVMHVRKQKETDGKSYFEDKNRVKRKELINVGEKSFRSSKIKFKSPESAVTESNFGGGDFDNVGERCLRYRKIEFNMPEASPGSDLAKSTSWGSDIGNVSNRCLKSRKIEFKLPEASSKRDLAKSTCGGSEFSNVGEMRLTSRRTEFELPDALENNDSKDNDDDLENNDSEHNDDDLENRNSEENEVNVSDDFLMPETKEFELPVESAVENCESNVSSVKCLRSRKIAFQIVNENVEKGSPSNKVGSATNKDSPVTAKISGKKESKNKSVCFFIGEPIPEEEAQKRWHWRYELKSCRSKKKGWILNAGEEDETILNVEFHYAQANICGDVLNIGDCAYIKGEGRKKHIGRILEFFKTSEGEDYFRVQWFFRAEDTVIKEAANFHDKKRLFYSTVMNDNSLDCIISKVDVVEIPPTVGLERDTVPPADFYYDMEYSVEYTTFSNLRTDISYEIDDSHSFQPVEAFHAPITASPMNVFSGSGSLKAELAILDLYSGCGGMSTGLSIGAKISSINLVTRWAVDLEKSACDSLKLNHPETQVRNESAEDFLELLKRWKKLCESYVFDDLKKPLKGSLDNLAEGESSDNSKVKNEVPAAEYEVSCLVDICYGDPNETGKRGLHLKVRWTGYGPDEDTWEPIEGLRNCQERIQDFVRSGLRSKILPLPGHVDVICGGPPCQGISGYNRYRHVDDPLTDERNQQIVVFMDIVEFLKPKYVLMENVVDILKLDGASLGRYALSRLVHMKYQARLGIMAAGCYGLPQFRLRVFIWGALPSERLPPFPLPTHDVVVRYWPPSEFERNVVAYDEGQPRKLEEAIFLHDAIFELPAVTNYETREEMAYDMPPVTEFQKYIRLTREEMMGSMPIQVTEAKERVLYDHRPYCLNEDNYLRVCQIPHRKGANFRDLPGVVVGDDNVVRRDTTKDPSVLPSGEPIVPGCVFTFEKGRSKRPFARLWWDETVPTVLTFPHHRSQAILHPEQDRVLTIRECARLQGFPDFYRICGTVKERYSQVGNAVAIPVGRALGYALGMAFQKLSGDEPLMTLPPNFSILRPLNDEIVVLGN